MKIRYRFFSRMPPSRATRTSRNFSRETAVRLLINYGIQVPHAVYYTTNPFFQLEKPARDCGRALSQVPKVW